jgi:hypothetical protein
MKTSQLLAATIGTIVLLGAGCAQNIAEEATERAIERETGGSAEVDIGDNEVSFRDEESGATATWGEDVAIPSDFPADVLVYGNAKVNAVTMSDEDGSEGAWLTLSTSDSVATVIGWYESELSSTGWTRQGSYSVQGSEMRVYEKAGATITVSAAGEEGLTTVTVIRATE